jgi:L-2-hydroxyglutarate oxidase LhgO
VDRFDLCIIGAGVVGLAIAEEFAAALPSSFSILLLEQNERFGQETSSRNSEVIHAGLYYTPGSLKARLCASGRDMLYHYCKRHGIAHRRTGKLIVAQEGEIDELEALSVRAAANGVSSLQWLDAAGIVSREALVQGHAALYSPESGIIDSHGLMESLLQRAQAAGVLYAPRSRVDSVEPTATDFMVNAVCGPQEETYRFAAARVVNACGLQATALASRIVGFDPALIPAMQISKGNYFRYAAPAPFSHLVYPVPEKDQRGLGIHATVDLAGQVKFGPDVEQGEAFDYRVNPARREAFAQAVRRYFPTVRAEALVPDYAGLRPRIATSDGQYSDFLIQDAGEHGLPGLVQLFGIESPGLTASLALARHVRSETQLMW